MTTAFEQAMKAIIMNVDDALDSIHDALDAAHNAKKRNLITLSELRNIENNAHGAIESLDSLCRWVQLLQRMHQHGDDALVEQTDQCGEY